MNKPPVNETPLTGIPVGVLDTPRLTMRVFRPPPDVHGLKLDWHSPIGQTGVLLDWDPAVPTVDGGIPADVALVLATALCSVATVCGCTMRIPARVGRAWTPVADGHGRRFARWALRPPRHLGVLATDDPARVVRFFDEDYLDWSQESQLLVLSERGTLPEIDRALVDACFARPMAVTPERLRAAGVSGVVLPGVDGDMAGLYVPAADARQVVLHALAETTRAAGGRWDELDGSTHWSTRAVGPDTASVRR